MLCPVCHANNRESASFCRRCGAELVLACPSCSAPHPAGQAYCDSCGAVLPGPGPTAAAIEAASGFADPVPSTGPGASELRVASVLFVDLVGYTALSESRDAEDVRDLLGNYFERAKTIIDRYGGAVEKFIGDAVMAVWGVPVAREDDAERAVRAGLELVEAVELFGQEVGARCAPGPGSSPVRSPRSRTPARVW